MKNTLNSDKLKVLCTLLAMFVFVNCLLAQSTEQVFPGKKNEKKAEKIIYVICEQGSNDLLYNKNNSLSIYKSDFERKEMAGGFTRYVKFDRTEVDSLVYKIIAPFFRDFKGKYSDRVYSFDLTLFSKPDREISEMVMVLPRNGKVPLKVIEKLEKEILDLSLKLELTEDGHKYVIDALWTRYTVSYSVDRMKKQLKEKANRGQ